MKAVRLAVAVLILMALAQAGLAADLQAGWYANVRFLDVYTYGPFGPQLTSGAVFHDSPLGQCGPFFVSAGDPARDYRRHVTVSTDVQGAEANDGLNLPFSIGVHQGALLAYIGISWQTDYDSTQMRLDLCRQRYDGSEQLVWSQTSGGQNGGYDYVAWDTYVEGPYYFKVVVVPEPSTCVCLLVAFIPIARFLRRAK